MDANKREYQIQIFIRVHWRLFAVLLVRLYPIEIAFDDSKWWCSPRIVTVDGHCRSILRIESEQRGKNAPVVPVLPENESTVIHANNLES